jgi:hypothetical protein
MDNLNFILNNSNNNIPRISNNLSSQDNNLFNNNSSILFNKGILNKASINILYKINPLNNK